jgi:trk system potassium uptake protein TrkA
MKSQIAVIGMGIFGREVALSLSKRGFSVLAIDQDPEIIEAVKDEVSRSAVMDSTNEHALLEAKVDSMAVVVNAIGTRHIENSILTTALLRELNVPRIIARATNKLHERILRQVGANEVINPEREMGRKIAHQIARPGLHEVLSLTEGVCVAEVPVPKSFVGKTLQELDVRRKYNITVIGVQRVRLVHAVDKETETGEQDSFRENLLDGNRRMILDVSPRQDKFLEDDELVVIGHEDDVNRLAGLG